MGRIQFENLTKIYEESSGDDTVAVSNLNLEVEDGQFLVLVGPSGCGKTTTLRSLAGLEEVTEGSIKLNEKDITGQTPRERDIAMVFQNYALYPHMTVEENIGFPLKFTTDLSKSEIKKRVDETASMLGIKDLLHNKPGQLSGGQQQRVALGRAIIRQPQAFLFDEPLSNLDAKLRTDMRAEIIRLQRELGVTSVYVTHDQEEAMTMGDLIAVMNEGVLQQVGTPDEVYNHPTNLFVAGFIGSPSMNFLKMELTETNGAIHFRAQNDPDFELELDGSTIDEDDLQEGATYTLGIRPENVQIVHDASREGEDRVYKAIVDVIEPLGSDNFLRVYVAGQERWIARTDASYYPDEDDEILISFDLEQMHLFGPDDKAIDLNR